VYRGPRAQRVEETLRDRILGGDLPPGARLAPNARLAAEFGVALMTVRTALKRLEGEGLLSVEPGRGTFVRAPASPAVLVVDDDPGIRGLPALEVARAGFRALVAGGPDEALEALQDDPAVNLVMTDLWMPGPADGAAFVRAVHRRWPAVPIAMVTAHAGDLAAVFGAPECPVLVVAKPFRRRHVEEVLRLAGARGARS
jgi:CheY-like chemotaxis protein